MYKLTLEILVLVFICMWLFNLLSFITPRVKDIVNSVVIILLILMAFVPR